MVSRNSWTPETQLAFPASDIPVEQGIRQIGNHGTEAAVPVRGGFKS